jgi:hypothetical protein
MTICPNCKKELDAMAIRCIHCRKKVAFEDSEQKKQPLKYLRIREAIMTVIIFVGWLYNFYHPYHFGSKHGDGLLTLLYLPMMMMNMLLFGVIQFIDKEPPIVICPWLTGIFTSYLTAKVLYLLSNEEKLFFKQGKQ